MKWTLLLKTDGKSATGSAGSDGWSLPLTEHCSHGIIAYSLWEASADLKGISESFKALDDLASSSRPPVRANELQLQHSRNDNDQRTGDHSSVHARPIRRLVLLPEHCATDNAANATSTDECSTSQRSLPLATDIVRLPGEDAGHICVRGGGSEEGADVASGEVVEEAEHSEPEDAVGGVDHDEWAADVILVAEDRTTEHDDRGHHVRRRDEAL